MMIVLLIVSIVTLFFSAVITELCVYETGTHEIPCCLAFCSPSSPHGGLLGRRADRSGGTLDRLDALR